METRSSFRLPIPGPALSNDGEPLSEFAIAGADKKFVWANAIIKGDKVIVWNDALTTPLYVRYARELLKHRSRQLLCRL